MVHVMFDRQNVDNTMIDVFINVLYYIAYAATVLNVINLCALIIFLIVTRQRPHKR